VLECTHDYNHSQYYDNDDPAIKEWEGYDAFAQTEDAIRLLQNRSDDKPLFLMLSWGPPHNPYGTTPEMYRQMYSGESIQYRPNVPKEWLEWAGEKIPGYYAHISALDECLGRMMDALDEMGLKENTILVYTSDHGDMLGSQGERLKQKPWDESILVPFLLRYPVKFGLEEKKISMPINSPDMMPTLLDLCGVSIPKTVTGRSYLPYLNGSETEPVKSALLQGIHPFGNWNRGAGGKEFRGIRTERYTYVRDLQGPWLLYDNQEDPYQLKNLLESEEDISQLQQELERELQKKLAELGDELLPGEVFTERWKYVVDDRGKLIMPS